MLHGSPSHSDRWYSQVPALAMLLAQALAPMHSHRIRPVQEAIRHRLKESRAHQVAVGNMQHLPLAPQLAAWSARTFRNEMASMLASVLASVLTSALAKAPVFLLASVLPWCSCRRWQWCRRRRRRLAWRRC